MTETCSLVYIFNKRVMWLNFIVHIWTQRDKSYYIRSKTFSHGRARSRVYGVRVVTWYVLDNRAIAFRSQTGIAFVSPQRPEQLRSHTCSNTLP